MRRDLPSTHDRRGRYDASSLLDPDRGGSLSPHTPREVRQWMNHRPGWLEVRTAGPITRPALLSLDLGEREAIQLALDLGISTVLIDEAEGRKVAQGLHLEVRGTLGILERCAKLGKVDLRRAIGRLEQTSFRMSPVLLSALLARNPVT